MIKAQVRDTTFPAVPGTLRKGADRARASATDATARGQGRVGFPE